MGVTNQLNVLVFDIETLPGEAYVWSAKTRFIPHSMMRRQPIMLQYSAAWLHGGKVMADSLTPRQVAQRDDSAVVESAAALLREADIVLAHNGDNFDIPWIRGRAWVNDLEPLGPVASIDTRKLAAKDFAMMHNNLDSLIQQKLGTSKIKTDFSWWRNIVETADAGQWSACQKHINKMLRYCKKDTGDLRDLFKTMIPHVHRLPRLVDTTDSFICPYCGSDDLQMRGKKRTKAYTYQQYQCNNCKRYPSDRSHDGTQRSKLRTL